MPSAAVVAILLLIVAIAFWRPFRRLRTALPVAHLFATGHAFLLIGFVFALAFGLERREPLTEAIAPIVAFAAGWVGFATGMRFELRMLRTLPARTLAIALLPALASALVVGGATLAVLLQAAVPRAQAFAASLLVGAAAASSGPTMAAILRARRAGRDVRARSLLRMIEMSAGLSDALVVTLALLAFALYRPIAEPAAAGWLLAAATAGGVAMGAATWLFLGGRGTSDERLLLGLAMMALIAGFGGWLLLSPAAVAAIAAFTLVNLPHERAALLFDAVRRLERPAVVILMTVIGVHVAGAWSWHILAIFGAMTVLRLAAKAVAGPPLETARGWGVGLTPQGILGLMICLSFFHVWQDQLARAVLAGVAAAGLANELLAPLFFVRLLRRVTARPARRPAAGQAS